MTSLTVELPDDLRNYLQDAAAERGLGDAQAYLVALAKEARASEAQERLESLLIEGLESGPAVPITPEFWSDLRREVRERVGVGLAARG